MDSMTVNLAYGQGHLPVELPKDRTTVIVPSHTPGFPDERAAVIDALENPIGAKPLRQIIKSTDRVCITFTDITNSKRLEAELRATEARLREMLGSAVG